MPLIGSLIGAETIVAIMSRTIATNTDVDRAALLEFVRPRHRMVLLTPRSDGGWQGSRVSGCVKALIGITPTRWSPVATGGFPARLA